MTCETCSAIFSRNECLHGNCISHQEELAEFKRKVDNHLSELIIRAWYSGKSLEVQTSEINNSVVSCIPPINYHSHNAQTSGSIHPRKNTAVGIDTIRPLNHNPFVTPTATPIDQGGLNPFRNPHTPPTLIHTNLRQVYEVK